MTLYNLFSHSVVHKYVCEPSVKQPSFAFFFFWLLVIPFSEDLSNTA